MILKNQQRAGVSSVNAKRFLECGAAAPLWNRGKVSHEDTKTRRKAKRWPRFSSLRVFVSSCEIFSHSKAAQQRRTPKRLRLTEKSQRAFTLAEVLVAIVFLALLVPVIMEGMSLSSRAAMMAERGTLAANLAQNKLDELRLDENADSSGDFGEDFPNYRWESEKISWETDSLVDSLTVRVLFDVQGREQSVSLTTLMIK